MNKVSILLIIINFCCTTFQNAKATTNPENTGPLKGSFTGKIIDAKTNAPIAGASVYFSDVKVGGATNAVGTFQFTNIP